MAKAKIALLLTGGGARAAYQVGALKAITSFYPRNHKIPFTILCGTSAGSVNATGLAVYASCFHLGVKKIEYIWRNFNTQQVFCSGPGDLWLELIKTILGTLQADYGSRRGFAILNNSPLRDLLNSTLDFRRIDRNIQKQYLDALCVTVSNYSNADSISFFQAQPEIAQWQRAKRLGFKTMINPEHLMASSAIPMIFPPSQIGQNYFCDGSVHQLSPLSPAIHLGADKILALSLGEPSTDNYSTLNRPPSSAEIAGHLLDTIFTDTLNSDLERLKRVNSTLNILHPDDSAKLMLKQIDTIMIKPKQSINQLATHKFHHLPWSVKTLLRLVGIKRDSESSLTSYLLFEPAFTKALIQLGYTETLGREEELRTFLEL